MSRRPRRVRRLPTALALLAAAVAIFGCSPGRQEPLEDAAPDGLEPKTSAEVRQWRDKKDLKYKSDADSPIPPALRDRFGGLSYFEFDPQLQFVVKLKRYEEPIPVRMITTEGEMRPAVKVGWVELDREGQTHSLQVYQLRDLSAESWESLFLPFLDQTSGSETYPAGRYVELAEGVNDWYLLDFNMAYHPLCAYGRTDYQCPRTPDENRLPFAIRAGERNTESLRKDGSVEKAGSSSAGRGEVVAASRQR